MKFQDAGHVTASDCAYLCPRHACSKSSFNGPCGGSAGGRCELDDKECFWARVYERLKAYGETQEMLDRRPTIYNPKLRDTSAWANFYLDRDHSAPETGRIEDLLRQPASSKFPADCVRSLSPSGIRPGRGGPRGNAAQQNSEPDPVSPRPNPLPAGEGA